MSKQPEEGKASVKNIKDYLPLYIGCQVRWEQDEKSFFTLSSAGNQIMITTARGGTLSPINEKDVTIILRPLSDMTEGEMKYIFKSIFKRDFPNTGSIILHEKTSKEDKRWVLWSGVDRLCVAFDGYIWADCDLTNWRYNRHEVTLYLLKKSFDLFGLIESGLAINKTQLL